MEPLRDVAATRLDNALILFDEFVHATVKQADAATLRGLERRFAERLQIQPSYWSQIKSRSRQIGERLARQFEQCCRKPMGWMDTPHQGAGVAPVPPADAPLPQDDDERFIVGLVLTYYRRHPQRARNRLLDLLGEVLMPVDDDGPTAPSESLPTVAPRGPTTMVSGPNDDQALWQQSRAGVAPLKPRGRR